METDDILEGLLSEASDYSVVLLPGLEGYCGFYVAKGTAAYKPIPGEPTPTKLIASGLDRNVAVAMAHDKNVANGFSLAGGEEEYIVGENWPGFIEGKVKGKEAKMQEAKGTPCEAKMGPHYCGLPSVGDKLCQKHFKEAAKYAPATKKQLTEVHFRGEKLAEAEEIDPAMPYMFKDTADGSKCKKCGKTWVTGNPIRSEVMDDMVAHFNAHVAAGEWNRQFSGKESKLNEDYDLGVCKNCGASKEAHPGGSDDELVCKKYVEIPSHDFTLTMQKNFKDTGNTNILGTKNEAVSEAGDKKMFKCQECGKVLPESARKCSKCGSEDIDLNTEGVNFDKLISKLVEEDEGEPEEDDITTEDHQNWYMSGKLYFTGSGAGLQAQMNKDGYWPNCWFISDHGNAHLITNFRESNEWGKATFIPPVSATTLSLRPTPNCPQCGWKEGFILSDGTVKCNDCGAHFDPKSIVVYSDRFRQGESKIKEASAFSYIVVIKGNGEACEAALVKHIGYTGLNGRFVTSSQNDCTYKIFSDIDLTNTLNAWLSEDLKLHNNPPYPAGSLLFWNYGNKSESIKEDYKPDTGNGEIALGLYLDRVGMDAQGNYSVWVSKGSNRAKKIQTNGNAPAAHHKDRQQILADPVASKEIADYFKKFLEGASQNGSFAPSGNGSCDCGDRGCPVHKGSERCPNKATVTVYRIDMNDPYGSEMCDGCAEDAMDSGVFGLGKGWSESKKKVTEFQDESGKVCDVCGRHKNDVVIFPRYDMDSEEPHFVGYLCSDCWQTYRAGGLGESKVPEGQKHDTAKAINEAKLVVTEAFYLHVTPEMEYTAGRGWHVPDVPTGKWVLDHSSLPSPWSGGGQMLMVGTKDEVMKAANNTAGPGTQLRVWDIESEWPKNKAGLPESKLKEDVGDTIFQQLKAFGGPFGLLGFIGANGFVKGSNFLMFRVKGRNVMSGGKIKIILDPSDTYTVELWKLDRKADLGATKLDSMSDVYVDSLADVIKRMVG